MHAKSLTLLATLALTGLAGAVRADDITPDHYRYMETTRTRAEVVAERDAARVAGDLHALDGEDRGSFHLAQAMPPSVRTRAQVHAEVLAARRDGSLDAYAGEDSGSFFLASGGWADPIEPVVRVAMSAH